MTTAARLGTRRRRATPALGALLAAVMGAGVVGVLVAGDAPPARALSTKTFGLTATGEETAVVVPAGTGTVIEHFDLYSLSHRPITVALGLRSVSVRADGTQAVSSQVTGLAADLQLPQNDVTLKPNERRTLVLVVHRPKPSSSSRYAEITAAQVSPGGASAAPASPLALIVVLEPDPAMGPADTGDSWHLAVLAIAGALAAAGLAAQVLTRRRSAVSISAGSLQRAPVAR